MFEIRERNYLRQGLIIIAALLSLFVNVLSQDRAFTQQREMLATVPKALPSDLWIQAQAVGSRLQKTGKEETVLTGVLVDSSGQSIELRVVHQLSGMVRIEGLRRDAPLTFDGDFVRGTLTRMDESLLETFVADTIEGMIFSARSGGSVRLLGRDFAPDRRVAPDYKGPHYDIFEVTAPMRTRLDRQLRTRRYYFDSSTRYLLSTRYVDPTIGVGVPVDVRFSNWMVIDGASYPARIERYEAGSKVFTMTVTAITGKTPQPIANFR